MEIGKMEALGEEAGWKREDEGGQAMESLGTGARDWRRERRDWRRRKEWKIGRRKGASLLKAAQKRAKSSFFVTNNVKNVTF